MSTLAFFQSKIEEIAREAGVSAHDCASLETMLAALPWEGRRRLRLFLQGVKMQFDNPEVQRAADEFLLLASKVWRISAVANKAGEF